MKEREAADKAIEFQDSVHKFRLIHVRCLYLMNSEESSKLKKNNWCSELKMISCHIRYLSHRDIIVGLTV